MHKHHDRANKKKAVALSAAGLVLVAGATVTSLAAWTDTEWIHGGAGSNGELIGTSKFNVQQNVTTHDESRWTDAEQPLGGRINFSTEASSLAPGDTVYAFVRLRTAAGSDPGDLTLNAAHPQDLNVELADENFSEQLYKALRYRAAVVDGPAACNVNDLSSGTQLVDPAGVALNVDAPVDPNYRIKLDSNAGNVVTVCFALTLPESEAARKELQGQTVTPVWSFEAISTTP